jgi:hypothetical protein
MAVGEMPIIKGFSFRPDTPPTSCPGKVSNLRTLFVFFFSLEKRGKKNKIQKPYLL